jgi:uncharacterized protein YjbI with pentapeptide repeats
MKEKKGKKSLEDLHSLKKRSTSTLLKEPFLPNNELETISTSIKTISKSNYIPPALPPPSYLTTNISFCRLLGSYFTTRKGRLEFNVNNLICIGQKPDRRPFITKGWHYWVNPNANGTNAPSSFYDQPQYNFGYSYGYLFIFFTGYVCNACETYIAEKCKKMYDKQYEMFAVLINSIDQINTLNRIFDLGGSPAKEEDSQTSIYLSNALLNTSNAKISDVITALQLSDTNSPPLLRHIPISPLMLATNFINNKKFHFFQYVRIDFKSNILLLVKNAFTVSTVLPRSDFETIPFYIESIEGEGSELENQSTIKFLKSGNFTFTLFFKHEYFVDTENIFGNLDGPSTYGLKRFSLKINAIVDDNLSGINLSGINLSGENLSGKNLSGANLTNANLSGANLFWCNLTDTILTGANLTGADLTGANLSGKDLTGVNLTNANLTSVNLTNANLTSVNLTNANLTSVNLTNANLTGVNITNTNLRGAILTGANLTRANLSGENLSGRNLSGVNLTNANLSGANLVWCNLTGTILTGANLTGADLTGADLSGKDLTGVNLTNANLTGTILSVANLTSANLIDANLSDKDLTGTILTSANLTNTNLSDKDLSYKNLTGTILVRANLTRANLTRANLSSSTDLTGPKTDLTGANLTGANLRDADLSNTRLVLAKFTFADLTGVNLKGANLFRAILVGAKIRRIDLEGAIYVNTSGIIYV